MPTSIIVLIVFAVIALYYSRRDTTAGPSRYEIAKAKREAAKKAGEV